MYDGNTQAKRDAEQMRQIGACGLVGEGVVGGAGINRPDADPWKHRSQGMRCKSCMWFNPKAPKQGDVMLQSTAAYDIGRCRRHAPTMGGYPVVFVNDWCGDHRLDENRI